MAQAFNLTAQINLRGPSNIRQVVSDIRKQIGSVKADVKLNIDPKAISDTARLNKSLQELATNLSNVASSATSASSAIKNFGNSVSSVGASSSKLQANINKASKATKDLGTSSAKTSKAVAVARTEMEEFGRQGALAIRRFAAFSAVTGVFFSLNRAISSGLKDFIEFDRQLVRLQQVTGKSAEGLRDLQNEITKLSIGLGVGSDSLISVASTLAQAGLSANETKTALEALAKSQLAPSFDDINKTVEGSIALMRQFGIAAKDLEKALGSVNSVAAAFAVESGDIIAAIQRTGGVFASASRGVSEGTDALNEFIAIFTSVRQTTRESAETIATGLRTIFTRIQRGSTIEALREFGVTLTDAEGKFVGAYKAIELLSEGLNRIDPRDLKFSQIVEELGGFRQIGKVIPLIQQFAVAQEALKVAQAGQGSLANDAIKAQLSLANQITKVREEFLSLIRSLGQSDTFQTLARGALGFASGLIKITSALKGVLPALAILGAGASLRGLTQFTSGFVGGLKKVPKDDGGRNQSVAGAVGSNIGAALVGAKTEQVSRDLDQNSAALDKVSGQLDNLTAGLNSLNSNFNSINSTLNTYNTLLQQSIASLNTNTSSLDNLTNAINNLNLGGGTTVKNGGRILGFNKGGVVPGSGRGDKVPAMLEPGEVVMSNNAVNRYGRGNLVRMNRIGFKNGKGPTVQPPAVISVDDTNTQASHVGASRKLNDTEVGVYTGMEVGRGKRSAKFNPEQTRKVGLTAVETFKLDLPTKANQAAKTGGNGVDAKSLAAWIRHNPEQLFKSRRSIPRSSLTTVPSVFANAFADAIANQETEVVRDAELSKAFEKVKHHLSNEYLASKKDKVDLMSSQRYETTGSKQIRHEGFDLSKIRRFGGGLIQRFVGGGKSSKTTTKQTREIFDTSPTPMLKAIIARTEGKKPTARQVQLGYYAEEITDALNTFYDDDRAGNGIVPQNAKSLTLDETKLSDRSHRLIGQGDKGFAGLPVDRGYAMAYDQEAEYIFPPNSKFKITDVEKFNSRLFPGEGDDNYRNVSMKVQQLKEGGVARRNVGYIDYDVIANPANEAVVAKGMEATGVTGPRLYADKLTELAVAARKNQSISKLRAIYGVAGSGKTTLARGSGTDDAKLRKTERFPILSPEDIDRATEIILLSSSVSQRKLDDLFSATDRTYTLSSTTKAERDRVRSQRDSRDVTGAGLEGRVPGSTRGVSADTAVGEALLSDRLGSRSVVLGRSESGQLRRKKDNELVEVIKKKIGVTWGGFAPMTAGHESILDAASAMGYSAEDFLFLVGANEGIKLGDPSSYRTAVFNQDARVLLAKAGAGARGATVLAKAADFEVPIGFDISEAGSDRRKVLLPGSGSRAFVADKTPEQMAKYKASGYQVTNLERTGGISGTMVRDLIMGGNMAELQKVLSPGVYELISNNIGRIQNRANALPEIVESVKSSEATKLRDIEKQIKAVGISRIDKKKLADPEYAAKVQVLEELREQRDKIKRASAFEPYKLLDDLATKYPDKYALDFSSSSPATPSPVRTVSSRTQKANLGGMIRKFADAGAVSSTGGKRASRSEILKTLGSIEAAKAAGVQPTEIYQLLGLRNPNMAQQAKIEAVEKEYIKKINRKKGASQAILTRLENQGLSFAAAGMLGNPFKEQTYDAVGSTGTRKVKLVAGVMDKALANELDAMFRQDTDPIAAKAAEKAMIFDVLKRFGDGRQLYLDFDNTLATGADAMDLKDFRDPNRVAEALATAKPTRLATELRALTQQRPELLSSMSVITARPPSTLDLIQKWLAQQGLPIPRSQFTGVGGDANMVSLSDIPGLKAALLKPDSLFVDDDNQNIRAAIKRGGVESYKYGGDPILPNENTESSIQGGLLEKMVQNLGGPGAQKGLGFDFPQGLQGAAKYFGLPEDIPTDLKRTISGPSTIKDNITTYLKAMGFKDGGEAKAKKPKTTFGSGEFPFPKRISNAYFKEIDKILEAQRIEKVWESRPKNERMPIDEQTIQKEFDAPFNKEMFLASFKDAITRDTLYKRISQFARFVGLPEEDLSVALPSHIDFGGPSSVLGALAQFDRTGIGTRRLEGVDLSPHGFSEADKQDLFGYSKLIEEKEKEINKVLKTPVRTFDDGSFHYDDVAATALWQEIRDLKTKRMAKSSLNNDAIKQARTSIMETAAQTGRGVVSINKNPFGASKYDMLYHELTHQLINGLRTRQQDSFAKYKERVVSLFENDNDGLAEAFDALGGYNSADVVYGRAYKVNAIRDMLFSRSRQTIQGTQDQDPGQKDYFDQLNSSFAKANAQTTAKQFKPINPDVNKLLLTHPTTQVSQEVIDRMEDSGKEEFLTTLLEKAPVLNENLSSILDSTLNDLLGGAGIQRQKFASGGSVPALVSNGEAYVPPKLAKKIGYGKLNQMNQADKNGMGRFSNGGISVFKGPGTGTSDSIPTNLPVGSFIIREKATKALGFNKGGSVGVQRFAFGGTPDDIDLVRSRARAKGVSFDSEVAMMRKALMDAAKDLMNPAERQNTLRILALENKTRLEAIKTREASDKAAVNAEVRSKIASVNSDTSLSTDEKKKRKAEIFEEGKQKYADIKDRTETEQSSIQDILMQQIRSIDPTLAATELQNLSKEIVDGFNNGLNLNSIISSSAQLQEVFDGSIDAVDAQRIAAEQLAQQFGITEAAASSLASAAEIASKEIYDKNLSAAQRYSGNIAKASVLIAGFSSSLSSVIKMFGSEFSKSTATTAAAVEAFGATVGTVGAVVSQLPSTIDSLRGLTQAGGMLSGTPIAGTINNVAQGAIGLLANPFVLAGAGIGVAAVGLAAAFKEAHNAAREFEKQMASRNLENSLNKINILFDEFSKDMSKKDILGDIANELNTAISAAFVGIKLDATVPKMFWTNMIDAAMGGSQAAQRSMVLEKQGVGAYLSTLGGSQASARNLQKYMSDLAPQLAAQQSASLKPVADNAFKLFEQRLRTGSSVDDIMKELKDGAGGVSQFASAIARSNPIIEEQIIKTQARADLDEMQKQRIIDGIVAREAEKQTILNTTAVMRQIEFEKLNKAVAKFVNSLERIYSNMEMSINRASFEVQKLSDSAALASSSLSGEAKAGSTNLSAVNILQNRRAYSPNEQTGAVDLASSFFGSASPAISAILNIGDKLETSILSTINRTRRAEPGATNERVLASIRSNLDKTLSDLQIPDNLVPKLSEQIKNALKDITTTGDLDSVSFEQIAEAAPGLTKQIDAARRAQEVAVKALEFYQSQLTEYSNSMNSMIDLQMEANKDFAKASDILSNSVNELAKTFGREIDLRDVINNTLAKTRRQTGGATDPTDITRNILNLENSRKILQDASGAAANKGPSGKDEFQLMQNRLRNTNLALRQNYDALKNLAENTDIASAALAKIQEIQQRRQAGANLIEKLVTSSPEELAKLNSAMGRLNNNMQGIANRNTSSEQRGETLQLFNQIAPLLGDGATQNALKANVLESQLLESGMGINPMFAQILDSLRNPEGDSEMQQAIKVYEEGNRLQSAANTRLGEIKQLMNENTATVAAEKLKVAITGAKLNFESVLLGEIKNEIINLKELVKQRGPAAAGLATGGVVYASSGTSIDFAPRGTDTVPAMLTPGEFVVNRKATRNNLPLLQNINSGKYSKGGRVNYLADGGIVPLPPWSNSILASDTRLESADKLSVIKKNITSSDQKEVSLIPSMSYASIDQTKKLNIGDGSRDINSWKGDLDQPNTFQTRPGLSPKTLIYTEGRDNYRDPIPPVVSSRISVPRNLSNLIPEERNLTLLEIENYKNKDIYNKIIKDFFSKILGIKNLTDKPPPLDTISLTKYVKNELSQAGPYSDATRKIKIQNLSNIDTNKQFLVNSEALTSPIAEQVPEAKKITYNSSNTELSMDPTILPGSIDFIAGGNALSSQADVEAWQLKAKKLQQDARTLKNIDLKNFSRGLKETQESESRRELISSLEDFYNNKLFSLELQSDILNGSKARDKNLPLTIYNINKDAWENKIDAYRNQIEGIANISDMVSMSSDDFISLGDKGLLPRPASTVKSVPWVANDFADKTPIDLAKFIKPQKEAFGSKYFGSIETQPFGKPEDDLFFTYHKISKGTAYDDSTKTLDKDLTEYMVVTGGGEATSPLSALENRSLYIPANDWRFFIKGLQEEIELAKKNFDPETTFDPRANAFTPVLKLPQNFINADAQLSNALGKGVVIPSANNDLDIRAIDAFKNPDYIEYLRKKTENAKTAEALDAAKKGFRTTLTDKETFTNAKKVGVARAIYDIGKNKLGLTSQKPESLNDISSILGEIGGKQASISKNFDKAAPDQRLSNPQWLLYDAYRAFFTELYKGQYKGIDTDTPQFLKSLGLPIDEASFGAGQKPIPVKGMRGKTEFGYRDYNAGAIAKATTAINNIINREIALKSGARFAGSLDDETAQKAKITAGTARVRSLANVNTDEDIVPSSYKQIFDIGLDPTNVFASDTFRSDNYLQPIKELFDKGTDDKGNTVFTAGDNVLSKSMQTLINWYKTHQDRLLNLGLQPDILKDNEQQLKDPKSRNSIENDNLWPEANVAHNLVTGNEYGNLPQASQLSSLITRELKEPIEPINRARGGSVYASAGQLINFQPKGTDTVPAMLTPGEFVVNRAATQKNLPLLQSINSGSYNQGGIAYLAEGGTTTGIKPQSFSPGFVDNGLLNVTVNGFKLTSKDSTLKQTNSLINTTHSILKEGFSNNQQALSDILLVLSASVVAVATASGFGDVDTAKNKAPAGDNLLNRLIALLEASMPMAKGGVVYASTGQLINFQPKGTDTVPAMLTPGEFVVNRAATQKNLPLLKAINGGNNISGYSRGGVVYLQEGGGTLDMNNSTMDTRPMILSSGSSGSIYNSGKLLSEEDKNKISTEHNQWLNNHTQTTFDKTEKWAKLFDSLQTQHTDILAPILKKDVDDWNEYGLLSLSSLTHTTPTPKVLLPYEKLMQKKLGDYAFTLSPSAIREYERYKLEYDQLYQDMLKEQYGNKPLESFGFGFVKGIIPTLAFAAAAAVSGPFAIPAGIAATSFAAYLQDMILNTLIPSTNEYMKNVASQNMLANAAGGAASGVGTTNSLAVLARNIPKLNPAITRAIGGTGKLGWSVKSAGAGAVLDSALQYVYTGEIDPWLLAINSVGSGFVNSSKSPAQLPRPRQPGRIVPAIVGPDGTIRAGDDLSATTGSRELSSSAAPPPSRGTIAGALGNQSTKTAKTHTLKPANMSSYNATNLSYDQLVQMVRDLDTAKLKQILDTPSLLGKGANSSVWEINDHLAFLTSQNITNPANLLEPNTQIKARNAPQTEFESQFGGSLASVLDTNNEWLGNIITRASGISTSSADFIDFNILNHEKALDLLSLMHTYDESVFLRLFEDQLRLAQHQYGAGLADSKLFNLVFGQNRITPVDIGSAGRDVTKLPVYFPTGGPFRGQPSLESGVLSQEWPRTMKDQLIGPNSMVSRSIYDLIQENPRGFLDRLQDFEYSQVDASLSRTVDTRDATNQFQQIKKAIEGMIEAAHAKLVTGRNNSTQADSPPLPKLRPLPRQPKSYGNKTLSEAVGLIRDTYPDKFKDFSDSTVRKTLSTEEGINRSFKPEFAHTGEITKHRIPFGFDEDVITRILGAARDNMGKDRLKIFEAILRGQEFTVQDPRGFMSGFNQTIKENYFSLQTVEEFLRDMVRNNPDMPSGQIEQISKSIRQGAISMPPPPEPDWDWWPAGSALKSGDTPQSWILGDEHLRIMLKDIPLPTRGTKYSIQGSGKRITTESISGFNTLVDLVRQGKGDSEHVDQIVKFITGDYHSARQTTPGNLTSPETGISLSSGPRLSPTLKSRLSPEASNIQPQGLKNIIGKIFSAFVPASKKDEMVGNVFNQVAARLADSNPELSVKSLTASLDSQVSTKGAIRTIADITRMFGLPLDGIIPENLILAVEQAQGQDFLGSWNEALSIMKLVRPNKKLGINNTNRTVAHEVGHSLLTRFGEDTYAAYQKKIKDNIDLIKTYMTERPELFESYDIRTVGAGLSYLLDTVDPLLPRDPATGRAANMSMLKSLYEAKDSLPISTDQLQRIRDFYTQYPEGSMVPPEVANSMDIDVPGMPRLNILDFDPDGKLSSPVQGYLLKRIEDLARLDSLIEAGDFQQLDTIRQTYEELGTGANFDDLVVAGREEFLSQMIENIDRIDTKGLRILTEILDSTLSNTGLFDASSFYERMRTILNQRQKSSPIPSSTENTQPLMRSRGGMIYANKGQYINFQPKGTDTVPAMLTPGEFVINRASTQKYRPVLEAINNGNYSRGGIVNYLNKGGYLPEYKFFGGLAGAAQSIVGQSFDFTKYLNGLMGSITSSITQAFDKALSNLKPQNNSAGGVSTGSGDMASIDSFVNRLNNIANILSNIYIPPQITITGKHDVVVTINGDTVLNQLRPDLAGIVVSSIKAAFRDFKAKNPENTSINFDIDIDPNNV